MALVTKRDVPKVVTLLGGTLGWLALAVVVVADEVAARRRYRAQGTHDRTNDTR